MEVCWLPLSQFRSGRGYFFSFGRRSISELGRPDVCQFFWSWREFGGLPS